MKISNFEDFMKKYNLKNITMNESELQRVYNYPIYPKDSKIHSNKGFVFFDDGRMGGSHWTSFIVKESKLYYFDSFGGQPDKFSLNHLPKPVIYHNYEIQDLNSRLSGSSCLYFFYLSERMKYYDTILKMYFQDFKYAFHCIWKQ